MKCTSALLISLACILCSCGGTVTSSFEGEASYYNKSLDGNKTASGETYRHSAYTAAHRELAFGTKVRVTNKSNGKTVTVTINDRGPHAAGRVIDLSGAAAKKIGLIEAGVGDVLVEVLE